MSVCAWRGWVGDPKLLSPNLETVSTCLKKKLHTPYSQASYSQTDDESNMTSGDGESCTYTEEEDSSLAAASPSLGERSHHIQQLHHPPPLRCVPMSVVQLAFCSKICSS